MLRIAIAAVVSPLIFPWVAWPATNSAFSALAYGKLSWRWDFANAVLNAQLFLIHGYVLMFVVFVPLILLFRKARWTAWWIYGAAGVIASLGFFLLVASVPWGIAQPSALAESFTYLLKEPGGFINIFWVPQLQHVQLGTTIAGGAMMMCVWGAGIRGNPWFVQQSNSPLNQTRADDARAG